MRLNIPNLPGALCASLEAEVWFPERGHTSLPARQVCMACDVRAACLQWALDHEERFGVWGGMSPEERQQLAKRRAA